MLLYEDFGGVAQDQAIALSRKSNGWLWLIDVTISRLPISFLLICPCQGQALPTVPNGMTSFLRATADWDYGVGG